jgi:hypothetical protein
MHTLRRFYASVLLDAGESVKAVSELGHHAPGFTLRTYTHPMPSAGTRTRVAGCPGNTTWPTPRAGRPCDLGLSQ